MPAKPKPTKEDRPKKKKGHTHGICVQCGNIFHGITPQHRVGCLQELPVIIVRKNQTETQLVKMALDEICRLLTAWRDGCQCVLTDSDGRICDGSSQWGHVVPQGACAFLVYNLSNSFRQCAPHNGIHRFSQLVYHLWYQGEFGKLALQYLDNSRKAHAINDQNITDLREILIAHNELYANRFLFTNAQKADKVEAGYYGDIIRAAWIKEGRI